MENEHKSRRALVLGSTGLVGRELVKQLVAEEIFDEVHCFQRRLEAALSPRHRVHEVDFSQPAGWMHELTGEVLFLCLGTTLSKAGSKEAQWKVDYEYQFAAAEAARKLGTPTCVLVSSAGADPEARVFYSQMKGALEVAIERLEYPKLVILQPSLLDGNRSELRVGERIGLVLGKLLGWVPGIRKYRPIHVRIVAKAMINEALRERHQAVKRIALEEVFRSAENRS